MRYGGSLASAIQEAPAADMATPLGVTWRLEGENPRPSAPQAGSAGAPSTIVAAGAGTPDLGRTRALMSCGALLRRGALTDAQVALDWLGAYLGDAESRLAKERLKLVAGWYQHDAGSKEAQRQTETVIAQSEKEATEAKAAHGSALAEAKAASKRCVEAEASLKAVQVKRAMEA